MIAGMKIREATLAVVAFLWLLLLAGGVDAAQAGRIALVVGVQTFGGALLWRLCRGTTPLYLVELIGMGLALGTLFSLLSQQLFRVTPLVGQAWWFPTAGTALAVVTGAYRRRGKPSAGRDVAVGIDELGGVGLGLAVGLAFVGIFWRAHPLHWTGWWTYYVDIPYQEALATSVTTWGPGDNILAAGSAVRYHWFAPAWAGTTTAATSAAPFVVVTRVLPLVALLGIVCLVWAWARRLSERRAVPLLAVVLTTIALNVATTHRSDLMHLLALSPSLAFGSMWLLAAALVFTEHVNGRARWGLLVLGLLVVGCVGGKSSNLPALLGGSGLAAVMSVRQPARRRVWGAFAVIFVMAAVTFVVALLGSEGNLSIRAGATARVLQVLAGNAWPAVVVGTLAAVLVFAATWAGLLALAADDGTRHRPEFWFGVGAALAGLVLMSGLGHPEASQLYFPISSGVLVAVVSAWGLDRARGRMSRAQLGAALAVGAVAGAVGLTVARTRGWSAPFVVWALPVGLVLAAAARARVRGAPGMRGGLVAVLGWGVVTASVVTGGIGLVELVRAPGPAPALPGRGAAWSEGQRSALRWLQAHSAVDDVVVTNRQCTSPQQGRRHCQGSQRYFLTAALTHRRVYVEGADYAIAKHHPAWVDQRVALSRRFVDVPTTRDARTLWAAGVRWVVVDLASTSTRSWASYARPAFTTATTEVLRLDRP